MFSTKSFQRVIVAHRIIAAVSSDMRVEHCRPGLPASCLQNVHKSLRHQRAQPTQERRRGIAHLAFLYRPSLLVPLALVDVLEERLETGIVEGLGITKNVS